MNVFLHVCLHSACMPGASGYQKSKLDSLELKLQEGDCELKCEFLEPNLVLLQEQVFLTMEPSLKPTSAHF